MAQYGGDQQYRREVTQTDEHVNPVGKEYENVAQSDTGIHYEREVRRTTDEFGNPIHSATRGTQHGQQGLGTNIGHATGGTGTTYGAPGGRSTSETGSQGFGTNIGHATGGTGKEFGASGGRSTGETGYQGLGTERGSATDHNQGLSHANRGAGAGTYGTAGQQGLGGNIGTDYTSSGRSVGQTGYQGLGTEPTTGINQNQPSAAPVGGASVGTRTKDAEKKGTMEKIKEKLPGHR